MTVEKALLVLAALVPAVAILVALNWRGRPWSVVMGAVALGGMAGFPAYWIERFLTVAPWEFSNFGVLFVFAMVVAGMVEESCKFAAFWIGPGRTRWFAEEYDGILFAGAVSIGFAAVENVVYVVEGGFTTAWVRAFSAVPLHAACGILMGSYLGASIARKRVGWTDANLPLSGLLMAVALHGLYDTVAFTDGNVVSAALLGLLLLVSAGWCVRQVRATRRRSPSFGGVQLRTPPPIWTWPKRIGPVPARRNPWLSAALGLIPGVGQAYNGDRPKALIFGAIGVFNLALYWMVHFLMYQPQQSLQWMEYLGVVPKVAVTPLQFAEAIEARWMLVPILLSMVVTWELAGAVDAYLTASQRYVRPQLFAVRRSFASYGFGSSYVVHLVVVLMLVFVPFVQEAASGGTRDGDRQAQSDQEGGREGKGDQAVQAGGQQYDLTWVGVPVRIDGWDRGKPEGEQHIGDPTPRKMGAGGQSAMPRGRPGDRDARGKGVSYNEYLSGQIRYNDGDAHYFRHVSSSVWSVVEYRILKDGTLSYARLLDTSGTPDEGERAVDVIRNASPFHALPGQVSSIKVVELFWSQNVVTFQPGSLEEQLSRLPDGRMILPEE